MECAHKTLETKYRNNKLKVIGSRPVKLKYAQQILEALCHCNSLLPEVVDPLGLKNLPAKHIVFTHQDLKPDNFMLDKNGNIKIIDFGLGRIVANTRACGSDFKWKTDRPVSRHPRMLELLEYLELQVVGHHA